jgi:hypothetical protein
MTFEEWLDQAIALLQRRGRVPYRGLKRQFDLDDDILEDLREERISIVTPTLADDAMSRIVEMACPSRR